MKILESIFDGGDMVRKFGLNQKAPCQRDHFFFRRGWLNGSDGLLFDGRNYHLYYQHSPHAPSLVP